MCWPNVNCKKGIPSNDKGRHGFDGQKCAHTASSPLTIRQVFSAGLFLSGHISAPTKLLAPASDGFSRDFWFLRCRLAGASQGEKGKKRRKDTLSGVFALVNRWYLCMILCNHKARQPRWVILLADTNCKALPRSLSPLRKLLAAWQSPRRESPC